MGSSSLTGDGTWPPALGTWESQPLNHHGSTLELPLFQSECDLYQSIDIMSSQTLTMTAAQEDEILPYIFKVRKPCGLSSVQSLSRVRLFVTSWTAACEASLSITNSRSLLKPMSIESVMPSNRLILCCPLLLPPSIFPSIRVFSNDSALRIRWPKYWSFSFSISPSNEYSELICVRMDWLDLLAVQGTLKSLLQHHSSKACSLQ